MTGMITTPFATPAKYDLADRRWSVSYEAVGAAVLLSDCAGLVCAAAASGSAYHYAFLDSLGPLSEFACVGILCAALLIPVLYVRGNYEPGSMLLGRAQVALVATLWTAIFLFLAAIAFGLKTGASFSRGSVFAFYVLGLLYLTAQRFWWKKLILAALSSGHLRTRNALLVEARSGGALPMREVSLKRHGVEIVSRVALDSFGAQGAGARASGEMIGRALRGSEIDEIFVVGGLSEWQQTREVLAGLEAAPLRVRLIPEGSLAELLSLPVSMIGSTPVLELQRAPLRWAECVLKRAADIVLSALAVFALAPLLAMVAALVRHDTRGPVIFRQTRHGFNGKPFTIFKFRSMTVLENGSAIVQATRNDARVTAVGRWIRRTSIDELPQLFNVLRGEMSLVGPRPHAVAHDNEYDALIAKYAHRQHVKPGITGWAQVNGYRGETATVDVMESRIKHDLWYIANWSFWLDLKILARTAVAILVKPQAY
jgi:Undecaprenyl-phosphate glucose phosphotransferase